MDMWAPRRSGIELPGDVQRAWQLAPAQLRTAQRRGRAAARRSPPSTRERKAAEISSAPQRPAGLYHL